MPEFVVCCRESDPDPACITEPGHGIGFCSHCGEPVRVSETSAGILFDGAALLCVQCFALVPNTLLIRHG